MDRRVQIIKKGIVLFLLTILILPFLQYSFGIIEIKPLTGAFVLREKPVFNKEEYSEGIFQEKYNGFLEDHIGFRESLIRLHNSIRYFLFGLSSVDDVVVGKNGNLYNPRYINAINGKNYITRENILTKVKKIKALQDTLSAHGKLLIVVFAPGKASYEIQDIPSHISNSALNTNYTDYVSLFNQYHVNFLDLKSWFIQMKDSIRYPLFPLYGTHWSMYGTHLTADSIVKYVALKKQIQLNEKKYLGYKKVSSLEGDEYDLGALMNLSMKLPLPGFDLYDPEVSYDTIHPKPTLMAVSDSYFWNLIKSDMTKYQFDKLCYYFYFNQAFIDGNPGIPRNKTNVKEQIKQSEVVILMCTEGNDETFPFGFPEYALAVYDSQYDKTPDNEKEIFVKMWEIRNSKEWMEQIRIKAKNGNISEEEQIRLDAIYSLK